MRYHKERREEELYRRGQWREVFIIFPKECQKNFVGELFKHQVPQKLHGIYDASVYLERVEMREYWQSSYDGGEWCAQYRTLDERARSNLRDLVTAQELERHRQVFVKETHK